MAGVLVNAAALVAARDGVTALVSSTAGLVSLAGTVLVGTLAMVLTQLSFQAGSLAASFPANEAAAPVAAVIFGAALLQQHVPLGAGRPVAYLACLAVVVVGTSWLARTAAAPESLPNGQADQTDLAAPADSGGAAGSAGAAERGS